MKKILLCSAILIIAVLASCVSQDSVESWIKEHLPNDIDTFARNYIDLVRSANFQEADSLLGEELQKPDARQTLRLLQGLLDAGQVESTEVVALNKTIMPDKEKTRFFLEYYVRYDISKKTDSFEVVEQLNSDETNHLELSQDKEEEQNAKMHQIVTVVVDDDAEKKSIVGFHVNLIPKPVQELNSFSLVGMGISRQAFLVSWILVPLFSLYVAILCLRTKMRLKFLWFLFIIVGAGKLTMNWTTGQLTTYPLSIQLLGASFFRPGLYGPWLFSVSWPLGAMIFYFRRKKLQVASIVTENAAYTADSSMHGEHPSDTSTAGNDGKDEEQQELDL